MVVRERLLTDYRDRTGPFDVIGDVHGCLAELEALLGKLGYVLIHDEAGRVDGAVSPAGRTAVFLGDLVDRGPDSPGVLRLVMGMVATGDALAVPGNHENKLTRALSGRNVQVSHGLAETLSQLAGEDEAFRKGRRRVLPRPRLAPGAGRRAPGGGARRAERGLPRPRVRPGAQLRAVRGHDRRDGRVRAAGPLPVAHDYRGRAMVLYGHTPTPEPEWINNTLCWTPGACSAGG